MAISTRILVAGLLLFSVACGGQDRGGDAAPLDAADGTEVTPPPGVPIDLAPFARLAAADPVLKLPLPWPREAEDAVAAIRDDHAETAWRAPAGSPWIEVDLLPLVGTPVALDSLGLTFEDHSLTPAAAVLLSPACGMDGDTVPWPLPEVALDLGQTEAGCVRIEFDAPEPFSVAGMSLVSSDRRIPPSHEGAAPAAREIRHPRCGVVEGFYGVPWSWRERSDLLEHMAALGLGTYVYGPKKDPLHRKEWRGTYPPEFLDAFEDLAARGASLGVDVHYGISPFVDWDDEADYATLRDKLLEFVTRGVQGVTLLADDIEVDVADPVDGAMGAIHAEVANRLLDDLRMAGPTLTLWFVPTVYSDQRLDKWEGGADYLEALASLHPDIAVLWTGTGTFAPTLSAADMERVTGLIGRAPVIWDNYWANDAGDFFTGRVLLAPLDGRATDLPGAIDGFLTNPMIQGALSRMALTTLAAWLDDPATYEAEAGSAAAAAMTPAPAFAAELFAWFNGANNRSPGFEALKSTIAKLLPEIKAGTAPSPDKVGYLLELLADMATAPLRAHGSALDPDTADELVYPLRKVRLEGETGLRALAALAALLGGDPPGVALDLAEEALDASSVCRFEFSAGTIESLLDAVKARSAEDLGLSLLSQAEPLPATCSVAATWSWRPFEDCPAPNVSGLVGATVEGGAITWSPDRAGRHRVVTTCATDAGWGILIEDFICGW